MRYQFGYVNITDGHGGGTPDVSLSTITVPSPTGTGTATATINYSASTQVESIVDANGSRVEFLAVDNSGNVVTNGVSNRTKVVVKDPLGNVVYWYIAGFNANMSKDRIIDAAGNTTEQETYGSGINPLRPTSLQDGMSRTTTQTWDSTGNQLTENLTP